MCTLTQKLPTAAESGHWRNWQRLWLHHRDTAPLVAGISCLIQTFESPHRKRLFPRPCCLTFDGNRHPNGWPSLVVSSSPLWSTPKPSLTSDHAGNTQRYRLSVGGAPASQHEHTAYEEGHFLSSQQEQVLFFRENPEAVGGDCQELCSLDPSGRDSKAVYGFYHFIGKGNWDVGSMAGQMIRGADRLAIPQVESL